MNVRKEFAYTKSSGMRRGSFKRPFPVFPNTQYSASFSDSSRLNTPAPGRLRPQSSSSGPRTSRSLGTSTSAGDSFVILAITEGRGNATGEVGMACMDIISPGLTVCQLTDCNSYIGTLGNINVMNPDEILLPHTLCEVSITRIYNCIRSRFPNILITPIQRKLFNDVAGKTFVKRVCAKQYHTVQNIIDEKFYALCATSALMTTVERIHNILISPKSMKIEYQNADFCTLIDFETAYRLELVEPLVETNLVASLFGVVNHCITRSGSSRLRANILQPFCKKMSITTRHEGITELIEKPYMLGSIQSMLKHFTEVHKLLAICSVKTMSTTKLMEAVDSHMNTILQLKRALTLLPMLYKAVEDGDSGLFATARDMIHESVWESMLGEINKVIADDIQINSNSSGFIQRCYSVKEGVNHLLDIARKAFSERVEDLRNDIKQLGETHNLDLRMNYTNDRGFHVVLHLNKGQRFSEKDLPAEFNMIQKNQTSIFMTTVRVMGVDNQLKVMQREIQIMSNAVLIKLLGNMREDTTAIYCFIDLISEIDVVQSLAVTSSASNYIKPNFGNITEIIKGVHPILEHLDTVSPVPNSIKASDQYNFFIITGPNSSGKSVFIRQIALLQIMAQIGCFIPAEKATFRICDKIFSRLGFEDNIELNASSYVVEMAEMNYILNHMTRNSLIIIDELCRGTSEEEGSAMAWSICEEIMLLSVNKTDAKNALKFLQKPFVFFTTHFPELTQLAEVYDNVNNLHLEAIDEKSNSNRDRLRYTHIVKMGKNNIEDYGIKLAGASNVPRHIITSSKIILEKMKENDEEKQQFIPNAKNQSNKKLYDFGANVIELMQTSNPTKEDIVKMIKDFKLKNPELEFYINNQEDDSLNKFSNAFKSPSTPANKNIRGTITEPNLLTNRPKSPVYLNMNDEVPKNNPENELQLDNIDNSIEERNLTPVLKRSQISRNQNLTPIAGPSKPHTISRTDYESDRENKFTENSEIINNSSRFRNTSDEMVDNKNENFSSSLQNSYINRNRDSIHSDNDTNTYTYTNSSANNTCEDSQTTFYNNTNITSNSSSKRNLFSESQSRNQFFETAPSSEHLFVNSERNDINSNAIPTNFDISNISVQNSRAVPRSQDSSRYPFSPVLARMSGNDGPFNASINKDMPIAKSIFDKNPMKFESIHNSEPVFDALHIFSQDANAVKNKPKELYDNNCSQTQRKFGDVDMNKSQMMFDKIFGVSPLQACSSDINPPLFQDRFNRSSISQTSQKYDMLPYEHNEETTNRSNPIINKGPNQQESLFDNYRQNVKDSNTGPSMFQNMFEKFAASRSRNNDNYQPENNPIFESLINKSNDTNTHDNFIENVTREQNSNSNRNISSFEKNRAGNIFEENFRSRHQDLAHHSNAVFEQDTIPFIKEQEITVSEKSFSFQISSQTPSFICARTSTPIDKSFELEENQ